MTGELRSRPEVHYALSGYSGAVVTLVVPSTGVSFVRKRAPTPVHNTRLRSQMERQIAFQAAQAHLRVPEVLRSGVEQDCLYFDMQYVRARGGKVFLREATFGEVAQLGETLAQYLSLAQQAPCLNGPDEGQAVVSSAIAKIAEIESRVSDGRAHAALEGLRRLAEASDTAVVPPSLCHGDLSFENLLIGRAGTVWAIDQTPAPIESALADGAKLFQDLVSGWFLRDGGRVGLGVRLHLVEQIREALRPTDFAQLEPLLLGLTLARILPYVQTESHLALLLDGLEAIIR